MIICKCINKNRDSKGNIINYTLVDKNGKKVQLTGKQVKEAIKAGQFKITNLQIDSLGRLVDRAEATNKNANKPIYTKYILKEQYRAGKPQSLIGKELMLDYKPLGLITGNTQAKIDNKDCDLSEYIYRNNIDINRLSIFVAPFLAGYEIMRSNSTKNKYDEAFKKFNYVLKACNEHTDHAADYFKTALFLIEDKNMKPSEIYDPYDTPYIRATFEFTKNSFKLNCGPNKIEFSTGNEEFKLPYIKVALRILGYRANFKNAPDIVHKNVNTGELENYDEFEKYFPDKQYVADIVPYGVIDNFGKMTPGIYNIRREDEFCLKFVKKLYKDCKGKNCSSLGLDLTKIENSECPGESYYGESFVYEADRINLDFWWLTIGDDYENTIYMVSERNWKEDGYVKAFRFYFDALKSIKETLVEMNADYESSKNISLLPDYSLIKANSSISYDGGAYAIVD